MTTQDAEILATNGKRLQVTTMIENAFRFALRTIGERESMTEDDVRRRNEILKLAHGIETKVVAIEERRHNGEGRPILNAAPGDNTSRASQAGAAAVAGATAADPGKKA